MTQTREEKAAVLCAWANDEKVVVQFLQANTWIMYYDRGRTMPPPVFDGSNWRIREKAKPVLLISKRESEQIQAAHARAEKAEAALQVAQQERDKHHDSWQLRLAENITLLERAEKAEAELAAAREALVLVVKTLSESGYPTKEQWAQIQNLLKD
jgi:hypothetical protein